MRRAIWIVVAVAAGCYQPRLEGSCEVRCDLTATSEAAKCPSGLTCAAGLCINPDHPQCADSGVDTPKRDPCTMASVSDDFNNAVIQACGSWGLASSPSPSRPAGQLLMSPPTGPAISLFCTSTDPFDFTNGVFVEIPMALGGLTTYTQIEVSEMNGNGLARLAIARNDLGDALLDLAVGPLVHTSAGYDPVTMRWLRLRPVGLATIAGDYSANGLDWIPFGTVTGPVPPTVRASLGAGTYMATQANPGVAAFDNFDVCPGPGG